MRPPNTAPADYFHRYVWPERAHVVRTALFLTHRQAEAEDLAQETMLKAWGSLSAFTPGVHGARPWLLAILRHCWVDRLRRSKLEKYVENLDLLAQDAPAEDATNEFRPVHLDSVAMQGLLEAFSDQKLIAAIKQMPVDHRWVTLLVDVHGYTYEEAASALEIPVGTVRSRLFRARDILRKLLTGEHEKSNHDKSTTNRPAAI